MDFPAYYSYPPPELTSVSGYIKDAQVNALITTIGDLSITFSDGTNVYTASIDPTTKIYTVKLPKDGTYTRQVSSSIYASMTSSVDIIGVTDETNFSNTILVSKLMSAKGVRIVLTWGPTPKDLDAHIILPTGVEVNYNHKVSADRNVSLDTDSKLGNGVETISINNETTGLFKYYVQNYSKTPMIKDSKAKVQIFLNNKLVEEIEVPTSDQPANAYIWNVLTYNAANGTYVVKSSISTTIL